MICLCDEVTEEAKKLQKLMYEIRKTYTKSTQEERKELYELTEVVSENLPRFSAAGYFLVGKSIFLKMLETTAYFLIIVLQFSLVQKEK